MRRILFVLSVCLLTIHTGFAQKQVQQFLDNLPEVRYYNADSVRAELDRRPYFTLFRDNYFIGGIPTNTKPTSSNSDVRFQLSIQQKLTKSNLPFDTYLFIQYTQKAFWNVIQESMPMREMNFNPGIGLGHLIIYKDNYIGKGYLMLEHESNGKDSLDSRSWNKVTLCASIMVNNNWEAQFRIWAPIIDSGNNRDILRYNGLFQVGATYRSNNKRLAASALFTKRSSKMSFNTQLELSYKFNPSENQYFFLQYYNGYGENLLEYNQFKSMLRIGFVIKPQDFSFF
ncbi:phospholipase A1 [Parabacteroides sp. PFB2-12]|uniref:phospholipase A n=1 Tax=unclassified Parabacteroides TaxID=2649774 RepID=UPI0024732F5B|nr:MULTISPECIES: phospholipase A [unclassified Parabacteroides]MDH6342454.1 phospholipase A1 [Parabacteroides sp. PM6-13]MDH6390106.1 phospholipase A1 [Parabacteroides sp. PFB2-12]MDL2310229.1 phospholipase A [Parabacteroides sp. OttesenSCG-928-B22]